MSTGYKPTNHRQTEKKGTYGIHFPQRRVSDLPLAKLTKKGVKTNVICKVPNQVETWSEAFELCGPSGKNLFVLIEHVTEAVNISEQFGQILIKPCKKGSHFLIHIFYAMQIAKNRFVMINPVTQCPYAIQCVCDRVSFP
jgi:hypothetical protein